MQTNILQILDTSCNKLNMDNLQKQVNSITVKYSSKQNTLTSVLYLSRDVMASFAFACFMKCVDTSSFGLRYSVPWWIFYSCVQGTIWTGVWVIAHECGHGAFSPHPAINDLVGWTCHSALLVPYFSWQYSHKKHHKYTNHLIQGETHVPITKSTYSKLGLDKWTKYVGDDAFAVLKSTATLLFGWPLYLWFNSTGGRVDFAGNRLNKRKSASHFHPDSQLFPPSMKLKVILSDAGLLLTLCALGIAERAYGFGTTLKWYWGAYLVTNAWLVGYTYLQHTSVDIPHYGEDSFTWLQGALCTIDRPYPYLIDEMHHYIGSTHVLHHLNYRVPHYYAKQATKELKSALGASYKYDRRPIAEAMIDTMKRCNYVDDVNGTQYYK